MSFMVTKIDSGLVEGLPAGNQAITVFKGIPYAKPAGRRAPLEDAAATGAVGRGERML